MTLPTFAIAKQTKLKMNKLENLQKMLVSQDSAVGSEGDACHTALRIQLNDFGQRVEQNAVG